MKKGNSRKYLHDDRKKLNKVGKILNQNSLLNRITRIIVGAEVIAMIQTHLFTLGNTPMLLICKFVDFALFNIIPNNLIYVAYLYLSNMIIGLMGGIIFDKLYTKILKFNAKLSNIGKINNDVDLEECTLNHQIESETFDMFCDIGTKIYAGVPEHMRASVDGSRLIKTDDSVGSLFASKLGELEKLVKRRRLITESLHVKPEANGEKILVTISNKTIKYFLLFHFYMPISSFPYISRILYSFANNAIIYDSLYKALELIFIVLGIMVGYTTVEFAKRESKTLIKALENIEKRIGNREIFELGKYNYSDLEKINAQIDSLMEEIVTLGVKLVVQDKDTTTTNKTLNKPKPAINRTKFTSIKPIERYWDDNGRVKVRSKRVNT